MPANNRGFLGEGQYASRSEENRAVKRVIARSTELVEVEENDRVLIDPNPDWSEPARLLWVMAWKDEAASTWGNGDAAQLWLLCEHLSQAGMKKAYSLEIVLKGLNELRLSDRAKRQDGILVLRGEEKTETDEEKVIRLLEGTEDND